MSKLIADAPWIRETEATGHCSASNGAWWNTPSDFDEDEEELEDTEPFAVYDPFFPYHE